MNPGSTLASLGGYETSSHINSSYIGAHDMILRVSAPFQKLCGCLYCPLAETTAYVITALFLSRFAHVRQARYISSYCS